jgi:mediator of RNA polymerase II transcription subunit 21
MPPLAKIPKDQPSAAPIPAGALQNQTQAQAQGSPMPGHQQQQPESQAPPTAGGAGGQPPDPNQLTRPDSPRTFEYRQRELARDLIIKEQQIEYLIGRLPGIGSSEAEQEARIRQLEGELRQVEAERERKARELRKLGRQLEVVLGAVERGIYARR